MSNKMLSMIVYGLCLAVMIVILVACKPTPAGAWDAFDLNTVISLPEGTAFDKVVTAPPLVKLAHECNGAGFASLNFRSYSPYDETISMGGRSVRLPANGSMRLNLVPVAGHDGWFLMGPVNGTLSGPLSIKGYEDINSLGDVYFSEVCS